jgi:mRNA-degrading endonuclease RelE of RelBE toxin-antitoxin system
VSYEVLLSLSAVEDVLRITLSCPSKAVIIEASKQLQEALKTKPRVAGEHLSEGLFYIDREPLRAFFTVDDDRQVVEIINVHQL